MYPSREEGETPTPDPGPDVDFSMLEVELAWAASPAADDPALLDRLITWAAEDWPAWRMAALAEREGYRHPEGRPYTPEEMWSIVITPELVG